MFRAYDSEHDRFVALKILRLDLPPDRAYTLVAELETLVAAHVSHPTLAAPLAAGLVEASPYLAQELVVADALDVVAGRRGRMASAEVIQLITALAAGLDYAAAMGAPHGGLHPRDVLVTSAGPRTTGIGVVRALERGSVATPHRRPYVAPERTAGAPWDGRADVFSVAAIAFELLWGRRLIGYGGQAVQGVRPISGTDAAALQSVFARALSEDPSDRFKKASTFAEEVAAAFDLPRTRPEQTRPERSSPSLPLLDVAEAAVLAGSDVRDGWDRKPGAEAASNLPLGERSEPIDRTEKSEPPERGEKPELLVSEPSVRSSNEGKAANNVPPVFAAPPAERQTPAVEDYVAPTASSSLFPSDVWPELPQSRPSNVWPLVLALVLGLSVGFAGGYGVGSREGSPAASPSPASESQSQSESRPPATIEVPSTPASPVTPAAPITGAPVAPAAPITSATPVTPPTIKGRVVIRSTPSGARVWLDGREAGVAPLTLQDVPAGSHTIRLALEGHLPVERRVTVGPEKASQAIAVELAAAHTRPREPDRSKPTAKASGASKAAGSLQVDSRPAGANVFVDSKPVGKTPLLLESLEPGDHGVRLELDGYRAWSSSTRITAGGRSRVAASLEQ